MEETQNIYIPPGHAPAKIVKLLTSPGQTVEKYSTPLLIYECDFTETIQLPSSSELPIHSTVVKKTRFELESPFEGVLSEFIVKAGDTVQQGQVLLSTHILENVWLGSLNPVDMLFNSMDYAHYVVKMCPCKLMIHLTSVRTLLVLIHFELK
jgi:hypothetical protein